MINTSWCIIQYDVAAAFTAAERSPLPPVLSANDLPSGRTQVLNVCQVKRIDCHPAKSIKNCTLERLSYTEIWLYCSDDLDIATRSEDDCDVYNDLNMELLNGIKAAESPKHHIASTAPNVPLLIARILRRYDTD
jgi:hypothetical protein